METVLTEWVSELRQRNIRQFFGIMRIAGLTQGGSGAADDPAAPSPLGSRSRPGGLSDDPSRASASLSVPALVTGNQIDGGFYKGFFRSLLRAFVTLTQP